MTAAEVELTALTDRLAARIVELEAERDDLVRMLSSERAEAALERIRAVADRGDDDTFENLQTLCRPCNSRKGARV